MKYRTSSLLQSLLVAADIMLIWIALYCSSLMREWLQWGPRLQLPSLSEEWILYVGVAAIWLAAAFSSGVYQPANNRVAYQEMSRVLRASFIAVILVAGIMYLTTRDISRLRFWYFAGLGLPLLLVFRLVLRISYRLIFHRSWRSLLIAPARVVVVGEGAVLYDTLCTLSIGDPHEVAVLGFLDYQVDLALHIHEAVEPAEAHQVAEIRATTQDLIYSNAFAVLETSEMDRSTDIFAKGLLEQAFIEPIYTPASMIAAARNRAGLETEPGLDLSNSMTETAPGGLLNSGPLGAGISPLGAAIEKLVISTRADNVVIAISRKYHHLLALVLAELQRLPVHIVLIPDVADLSLLNVGVTELGSSPALKLRAPILSGMQLALKRTLDLTIVGLLLPFLLPIMAIVALAIKLDSKGPIIFTQRRVGQYGRPFTIFKFRTMVTDAEQRLAEVTSYTQDGKPMFKSDRVDPRVTRVGAILRRLSLDEVPQLFNVLLGQMSLVGPRPELPTYVGYYDTWQHFRLWVPPGITGWWQVKGREKQPMYLHWDDDIYYIKNYSLMLDLQILWLTLSTAIVGSTGR